jgi:hypothetical protein
MIGEPLGGSLSKMPGVSKKNRTNTYKNMKILMLLYNGYIKINIIAKVGCIYGADL